MITGTLYIEKIDGIWQSVPASVIRIDPEDDDRLIVMFYPSPPNDPVSAVPALVVSASSSPVPPLAGEFVYVPH